MNNGISDNTVFKMDIIKSCRLCKSEVMVGENAGISLDVAIHVPALQNEMMKTLIARCWDGCAMHRPPFPEILETSLLQRKEAKASTSPL